MCVVMVEKGGQFGSRVLALDAPVRLTRQMLRLKRNVNIGIILKRSCKTYRILKNYVKS